MPTQPDSTSAWWSGHNITEGYIAYDVCPTNSAAVPFANSVPFFVANDGATPQISPAVLALRAQSSIKFNEPVIHLGPEPQIAVNRWTYLWIDNPGPLTATATAGTVSVTLTATLQSVTWSMGEPASEEKPEGRPATLTCIGAGTSPDPQANTNTTRPATPGACAYSFNWRSLPERTGGTRTWPVTATAIWAVTWTSNIGAGGTLDAPTQTVTTPVSVGEWRSELIVGPS